MRSRYSMRRNSIRLVIEIIREMHFVPNMTGNRFISSPHFV